MGSYGRKSFWKKIFLPNNWLAAAEKRGKSSLGESYESFTPFLMENPMENPAEESPILVQPERHLILIRV